MRLSVAATKCNRMDDLVLTTLETGYGFDLHRFRISHIVKRLRVLVDNLYVEFFLDKRLNNPAKLLAPFPSRLRSTQDLARYQ